jgi:Flp pilus assembly protein TadD
MMTARVPDLSALAASGPRDEKGGIEALYATGHWLLSEDRAADGACVFRAMALLAPTDERSWLGLGACHEALEQPDLALKMYGTGSALARPCVRCDLARVRLLRAAAKDDEAEAILERAAESAESSSDEVLVALVLAERRSS